MTWVKWPRGTTVCDGCGARWDHDSRSYALKCPAPQLASAVMCPPCLREAGTRALRTAAAGPHIGGPRQHACPDLPPNTPTFAISGHNFAVMDPAANVWRLPPAPALRGHGALKERELHPWGCQGEVMGPLGGWGSKTPKLQATRADTEWASQVESFASRQPGPRGLRSLCTVPLHTALLCSVFSFASHCWSGILCLAHSPI
mmetsp:Transcript_9005/g.13805  ORF Transcript_9005/g.13805 Transcript_9005/m.13805 type:complete len:202 (-) Transcript_9005:740-1345(-)